MYRVEDFRIFNPQADQISDIKKATVVNCFTGATPVGESIRLGIEQAFELIERRTIELLKGMLKCRLYPRAAVIEIPDPPAKPGANVLDFQLIACISVELRRETNQRIKLGHCIVI